MSKIGLIHQAKRFFWVGILNTTIDFSVFFILVEVFYFGIVIANFIAFSVAVLNSYFCNKKWTFSASNTKTTLLPQLPLFVMVSFVGVILSTTVLWLLSNYTAVWIAKILATFISYLSNFILARHIVFYKSIPAIKTRSRGAHID